MRVNLDLSKNLEANANQFYEKAKKAKKKIEGVKKALARTDKKIKDIENKQVSIKIEKKEKIIERKKGWYEKFRWFFSSEDFLVIGGRDATTNDIIIKKKLDKGDLVFHTEIKGSPFFIIKAEGKKIGKVTINEAFQACASFSRAWKLKITTAEVYCIKPDQVKKELGLPKGAFMIYGKREYKSPIIELGIGIYDNKIMCAPLTAIKKRNKDFLSIKQGDMKKSDAAKRIRAFFLEKGFDISLDDIISVLPSGGLELNDILHTLKCVVSRT